MVQKVTKAAGFVSHINFLRNACKIFNSKIKFWTCETGRKNNLLNIFFISLATRFVSSKALTWREEIWVWGPVVCFFSPVLVCRANDNNVPVGSEQHELQAEKYNVKNGMWQRQGLIRSPTEDQSGCWSADGTIGAAACSHSAAEMMIEDRCWGRPGAAPTQAHRLWAGEYCCWRGY